MSKRGASYTSANHWRDINHANQQLPGDITLKKGALTVQDKGISVPSADVTASGISLNSHSHTGVHGETSGPH